MRNTRKKKTPVTTGKNHSSSSSPNTTRTLIRRFHVLLKKQRQLQRDGGDAKELHDVEEEIEQLGGLAMYQRMSSIGQGRDRGGGSEKVLIKWLVGMGLNKGSLSLLEVGALKPDNYGSCSSWITTTAIDLRSRHPSIIEQDFLAMTVDEHAEQWDIVSLSLVVNFVPEPKDRGRMLVLAHAFLRPSGLLFLVVGGIDSHWLSLSCWQLPSPCVENSRYMSSEHLSSLMAAIGFAGVEKKLRPGGKMGYWLYRKTGRDVGLDMDEFRRKRVFREGRRNNFCILLAV